MTVQPGTRLGPYEVVALRGSAREDYTVAKQAAVKMYDYLERLFREKKQEITYGPFSPTGAVRAVMDFELLGERTIWLDCDVLEADGGTRTASITGAYIALMDAVKSMRDEGVKFAAEPVSGPVAAVSVGIVNKNPALDLNYVEDSAAAVDMNVVMTEDDRIIEVQGTAEGAPFTRGRLNELLDLATRGIRELHAIQKKALS